MIIFSIEFHLFANIDKYTNIGIASSLNISRYQQVARWTVHVYIFDVGKSTFF